MKRLDNKSDFALNEIGRLSHTQIRLLIFWLLRYTVVIAIGGLSVGLVTQSFISFIIVGTTVAIVFHFIWRYALDLLEAQPILIIGQVSKKRTGYRGPTYYMLIVSDALQIRALQKTQWQEIEDYSTYKLFFTKRTKWLLSYKKLTPDAASSDNVLKSMTE